MHRVKQGYVAGHDGTEIFYESKGDGPALAFADGIGCFGYAWKYLWDYFQPTNRLIHYHYRGHGNSAIPKDQSKLTIQNLCDDLCRIFDADGVDKAVLFGHSMGCQVIFEFYRMFPDRCAGLVPMCGSYGHPLRTFKDSDWLEKIFPAVYTVAVLAPWATTPVWKWLVPTNLAWQVAKLTEINGHLVKKEDFMPYLQDISSVPIRVFTKMLDHASRHTAEDILEKIDVPTLIVAAEHDGFTPGWLSERMKQKIPGAEMIMIPKGTHTAPIEMPDLINLRVEKFLCERLGNPKVKVA